jgi:predicted CXXCH cytochrome family protein
MKRTQRSACLLPLLSLLATAGCGSRSAPVTSGVNALPDDPRLTYATPFKNVKPDVKYVGDRACAQCHVTHSELYHRHPMGRSLAAATGWVGQERFDAAARNPFTSAGFEFAVERRGGKLFHKVSRHDRHGRVLSELDAEVSHVVGSGEHGYSYLIEHDGYLFQSPFTWYTQKQAWDLAPGIPAEMHADRKIVAGCLYCHCNQVEAVAGTMNRYRQPIFRGYAIGCERCHGPGELHLARRQGDEVVEGPDDTIVNPRRLPPELREAICQQCHLNGEARVLRRGRETFDYRPGLPLQLFWSIFVRRPGLVDENKSVNHVTQMVESRCFKKSQGAMGCISCHDPHSMPPAEDKADYYRGRCLQCHEQHGCSLAAGLRRDKKDDCTVCHMPRFASTDIAHTAFTDHRVLRRGAAATRSNESMTFMPGETPLMPFHDATARLPSLEADRDLGLALIEVCQRNTAAQRILPALALPLLEAAVQAWPDDSDAAEARATALWLTGQPGKGLAACKELLERVPQRESSLVDAAYFSAHLGERDEAIRYWRQAIAVNPWAARYHRELAALLVGRQNWTEALDEARKALRLNPASPEARLATITCLVRIGKREEAQGEFEKLLALQAADAEKLRGWFADLLR